MYDNNVISIMCIIATIGVILFIRDVILFVLCDLKRYCAGYIKYFGICPFKERRFVLRRGIVL